MPVEESEIAVITWLFYGLAMLGAVLGVYNLIVQLLRDRVRLKIVPEVHTNTFPPIGPFREVEELIGLSIEVTNLSTFPVTITAIGLRHGWRGSIIEYSKSLDGKRSDEPPRHLAPRESMRIYFSAGIRRHPELRGVKSAFAMTACGSIRYGTSPALAAYVKRARRIDKSSVEVA